MTRYRQLFAIVIVLVAIAAYIVVERPMRRGLDLAGGMRVVYEARPGKDQKYEQRMQGTIIRILERRVNASGVVEPVIQAKGDRQFIVELPDVKNKEEIANRLMKETRLEFYYLKNVQSKRNPAAKYKMTAPEGATGRYLFTDPEGKEVPVSQILAESEKILTGADLKDNARADIEGTNNPIVRIEFKDKGKEIFAEFTRRHVDEILAIVLNGEILMAPSINEAILQGQAQISGFPTVPEAQELAEDLNAGALPVPLTIVEQNTVEATLGKQSVNQSLQAGIYGIILVVAFMCIYYLMPGVLACVALAMYALFTFAIFKAMGVTMTLPGLAGFILSIGMAVDANILIFERMKEELRAGKTLHSAIDAGFNRAWTAILDSNVCTLITCLVLIALTSGPVVGFAKTLAIGVLVSMFTAITVSRSLLHLVSNAGFAQNAKLYGLGMQWGARSDERKQMDIIGKTPLWFGLSGVVIAIGLFFLVTHGINKGIDFTGGSMVQVSFPRSVTAPEVQSVLQRKGIVSQVQISREQDGTITAFVRTAAKDKTGVDRVTEAIESAFKGSEVVSTSFVGRTISEEITQKAILAVVIASVLICLYLSFRFAQGGFGAGLKFGFCALLALIHDILVVVGASALFGKLYGWEIDGSYVTAVLTMVGFSVHDTIVIFDRIRENMKLRLKGETFEQLVNRSILQSFARSINTSLTVVLVLGALLVFGGSVIRHFNAVLLVGIVTGTYSSIFNASPLLVLWERQARRSRGQLSPAELKPLVQNPAAADKAVVGMDNGREEAAGASQLSADTAKSARTKAASASAKRRKRRF